MSSTAGVDTAKAAAFVEKAWPSIQSTLETYITIPNQSPMFEPNWSESGHTEAVISLFTAWIAEQAVPGLTMEVGMQRLSD